MRSYPKTETVWNRDEKFKVIPYDFRLEEITLIKNWLITEKIHGQNVRVAYSSHTNEVTFAAREDTSDSLPPFLLEYLTETFTVEKMQRTFPTLDGEVILFGEGYGTRIQKEGKFYREGVSFRLFDVLICKERDWWLSWKDVCDIADHLAISTVPVIGTLTLPDTVKCIDHYSIVSGLDGGDPTFIQEGVVARTVPDLFMRNGHWLRWKLKVKDFGRNGP